MCVPPEYLKRLLCRALVCLARTREREREIEKAREGERERRYMQIKKRKKKIQNKLKENEKSYHIIPSTTITTTSTTLTHPSLLSPPAACGSGVGGFAPSIDIPATTTEPPPTTPDPATLPYFFHHLNATNVTVSRGKTAILDCQVFRLRDRTVSVPSKGKVLKGLVIIDKRAVLRERLMLKG